MFFIEWFVVKKKMLLTKLNSSDGALMNIFNFIRASGDFTLPKKSL